MQNSKEYFEKKWIKYLKLKKKKKQDGRYSSRLYKKKMVCLPYVWMPLYIHNTKKACFVRLRGCPICPHTFGCPMFECPLYVGMPSICLDAPICLPVCWMPPVHAQHKESMLCQTDRVSICPHTFGCPCT